MAETVRSSSIPPQEYPHPVVTVDAVLLAIRDRRLCVCLIDRDNEPFAGRLALPGSFLRIDERLAAAVQRTLRDKAGFATRPAGQRVKAAIAKLRVDQVFTFDEPGRDPRYRALSVAYLAPLPDIVADSLANDVRFVPVDALGGLPPLAFDHADIIASAVGRLRAVIGHQTVGFGFLSRTFTLRNLYDVHVAVMGKRLAYPRFRARWIASGMIEPTGETDKGESRRPAQLYKLKKEVT